MDFNNEATMGKKPTELVSSIIIEKAYNFLEADEDWAKKNIQGGNVSYAIARARLRTLFFSSHTLLKRNMTEKDYEWVTSVCLSTDQAEVEAEQALEAFGRMFQVYDKIQLWKIDTVKVYNRERVEESNREHGY